MMIKFLQHGKGNPRLAAAYVIDEVDHLNLPRTGVDVLSGDPYTFAALCESSPHKWKYTSGVIAWSAEDSVSDEDVKKVVQEFEEYAFAGLEPHRYHLLAVMHKEQDGGKHVHILVPRIDLETGKSLNIAPPGHHKYFDCFRDYQNYTHGWARPDDPHRFKMTQEPNHVSLQRKAALKVEEVAPQPRFAELIEEQLLMAIAFNEIKNHQDVCRYIQMMPGVTAVESSKNAKTPYIAVKLEGQQRRIRLKGPLYEPTFCIDVYLQDPRAKQPTRRPPPQDQHVRVSYYGRYRKAYEERRDYYQHMYGSTARDTITGKQYAENLERDPTRNANLAKPSGANRARKFDHDRTHHHTGSEARSTPYLDQEQSSRYHGIEGTDPSGNAASYDRDSNRLQRPREYDAVGNATAQGRDPTLTQRESRNAQVLQGAQAEPLPTRIRGSEETSNRDLYDNWAVRFSRFTHSAESLSSFNDSDKFRRDHEAKTTTYLSDLSTSLLKENQDEQRIRRLIANANGAIDRAKQTLERTKSIIGKEESAIANRESEYQTIQSRHARFRQHLADSSRAIQKIEYELYRRYTYFNAESDTSFHTRQHHEKFERTLENASDDFGRRFARKHAAEDSTSHQRNDGTQLKTNDHVTRTRSFRLEASDQKLIQRALDIFSLRQRVRYQRDNGYDFEM